MRWAGPVLVDPPRERFSLPAAPAPPARSGFPVAATLAPVAVSLALWAVTGSIYSLLFAFLGPVVALGGLVDGRVHRRRAARRERARYATAVDRLAERITGAQERERERLMRLSPGTAPGDVPAWGGSHGRPLPVRLGTGTLSGCVELTPADEAGEPDDATAQIVAALRRARAAAAELPDAPIMLDARNGVGVVGPPALAAAVARGIACQLAARLSPADAVVVVPAGEEWTGTLPHGVVPAERSEYRWRQGEDPPVVIAWAEAEPGLPLGCGIVVRVGGESGIGGGPMGEAPRDVRPHAVTAAEAEETAGRLRARAEAHGLRPAGALLPDRVALADLLAAISTDPAADRPARASHPGPTSLAAPIGRDADGTVVVDLVAHGPHAVIAGTTGSGKSELLVSWVLGMAAGRSPDEVSFLLIDFKGGAAFAPLATLPHVLATLSDLDGRLTRRAIESLRAEILHRERVLAGSGVGSIAALPPGTLPRLVIVVDEFAAVVATGPELHEVFADLAARGRSLGLHLVLCTQRPAGVIRDAVLANVGLRLSLRVTDRGDSLAMIGTDAASRLPVDPPGRGILLHDGATREIQLAIAEPADAERIGAERIGAEHPEASGGAGRRPWCPPLPASLALDDLPAAEHGLAFGLVDLPAEQRQPTAAHDPARHGHLLVLGTAGAGASTALDTLAVSAQRRGTTVRTVPPEPADAWAVLAREVARPGPAPDGGVLLLIDDLDAVLARFDPDYRHEFLDLVSAIARRPAADGAALAVAARRLSGPLAGIAGLFGSRLLLRQSAREEHVLAGGDPGAFDPDLPPGSGTWRGAVVQVARASGADRTRIPRAAAADPVRVVPGDHPVLAIVAARPRALTDRLIASGARVIELGRGRAPAPDELHELHVEVQGVHGPAPTVLIGDPDAWQGEWALLTAARREWPIVLVDVKAADHRALLRDRELPPPLGSLPGECWLAVDGRTVRAVLDPIDPGPRSAGIRRAIP